MKVQITVDEEVWKQAKARAALNGQTLGELVGEALGRIVKAVIPVRVAEPVTTKALDAKPVEGRTVGAIPATGATLKPGYGWCMACKVEQVKLPAMLCGKCAKP